MTKQSEAYLEWRCMHDRMQRRPQPARMYPDGVVTSEAFERRWAAVDTPDPVDEYPEFTARRDWWPLVGAAACAASVALVIGCIWWIIS